VTAGVVGLVAAYLLVAVLLLSLNLCAAWRWPVKAGAIGAAAACFVVTFVSIQAMLGWPTEAAPPARFRLHAALVEEPDGGKGDPGAIFLWLSPRTEDGAASAPPRAYALPYDRALHEAIAEAQTSLDEGRRVDGRARRTAKEQGGFGTRALQVELFEAPAPALPPKSAG